MREPTDFEISTQIRRELSSRRIDLNKVKYNVSNGHVTISGEFCFAGLNKNTDEIGIELKFLENALNQIKGVKSVKIEFSNWIKNNLGRWEPIISPKTNLSASTASLASNDNVFFCQECNTVIKFCPCCGKPLIQLDISHQQVEKTSNLTQLSKSIKKPVIPSLQQSQLYTKSLPPSQLSSTSLISSPITTLSQTLSPTAININQPSPLGLTKKPLRVKLPEQIPTTSSITSVRSPLYLKISEITSKTNNQTQPSGLNLTKSTSFSDTTAEQTQIQTKVDQLKTNEELMPNIKEPVSTKQDIVNKGPPQISLQTPIKPESKSNINTPPSTAISYTTQQNEVQPKPILDKLSTEQKTQISTQKPVTNISPQPISQIKTTSDISKTTSLSQPQTASQTISEKTNTDSKHNQTASPAITNKTQPQSTYQLSSESQPFQSKPTSVQSITNISSPPENVPGKAISSNIQTKPAQDTSQKDLQNAQANQFQSQPSSSTQQKTISPAKPPLSTIGTNVPKPSSLSPQPPTQQIAKTSPTVNQSAPIKSTQTKPVPTSTYPTSSQPQPAPQTTSQPIQTPPTNISIQETKNVTQKPLANQTQQLQSIKPSVESTDNKSHIQSLKNIQENLSNLSDIDEDISSLLPPLKPKASTTQTQAQTTLTSNKPAQSTTMPNKDTSQQKSKTLDSSKSEPEEGISLGPAFLDLDSLIDDTPLPPLKPKQSQTSQSSQNQSSSKSQDDDIFASLFKSIEPTKSQNKQVPSKSEQSKPQNSKDPLEQLANLTLDLDTLEIISSESTSDTSTQSTPKSPSTIKPFSQAKDTSTNSSTALKQSKPKSSTKDAPENLDFIDLDSLLSVNDLTPSKASPKTTTTSKSTTSNTQQSKDTHDPKQSTPNKSYDDDIFGDFDISKFKI